MFLNWITLEETLECPFYSGLATAAALFTTYVLSSTLTASAHSLHPQLALWFTLLIGFGSVWIFSRHSLRFQFTLTVYPHSLLSQFTLTVYAHRLRSQFKLSVYAHSSRSQLTLGIFAHSLRSQCTLTVYAHSLCSQFTLTV